VRDGAARGDRRNEHFGWHYLADCALIEGDCAKSLALYQRSLELARGIGDRIEIGFEVQGVAMSLAGLGHHAGALALAGAVEDEFRKLGADIQVRFWNELLERWLGPARRALVGEVPAWTFEQAIERALSS
jgi:hypothetical protein